MQLAPAGDRAALLELGNVSAAELHAYAAAARALPGVLAVVVGHSSLYVVSRSPGFSVSRQLRHLQPRTPGDRATGRLHLPVSFTGPDLNKSSPSPAKRAPNSKRAFVR